MTTKRFPYRRTDGGISVIVPAPKSQRKGESESAWLGRIVKRTLDNATDVDVQLPMCEASELPSRRFRNAWREVAGLIKVDIPEARNIRMVEIRSERDKKLDDADKKTARELEQQGVNYPDWVTYKQALRDVPADIDLSGLNDEQSLSDFEPNWPTPPGE